MSSQLFIGRNYGGKAGFHRAFRREHDASSVEEGKQAAPEGAGPCPTSPAECSDVSTYLPRRRELPCAGSRLLYSADDPTKAGSARNAGQLEDTGRGPLTTRQTKNPSSPRPAGQGATPPVLYFFTTSYPHFVTKKTSPFAGLVGMLQLRAPVRRPAQPLPNSSYPVRRDAEFQSGCHPRR